MRTQTGPFYAYQRTRQPSPFMLISELSGVPFYAYQRTDPASPFLLTSRRRAVLCLSWWKKLKIKLSRNDPFFFERSVRKAKKFPPKRQGLLLTLPVLFCLISLQGEGLWSHQRANQPKTPICESERRFFALRWFLAFEKVT